MKLDVLFADWATTRAQNRWLFLAVAALSLALLLETSLLLGRDQVVVLVPPELSAETEIASNRAGQDYTKAWGLKSAKTEPSLVPAISAGIPTTMATAATVAGITMAWTACISAGRACGGMAMKRRVILSEGFWIGGLAAGLLLLPTLDTFGQAAKDVLPIRRPPQRLSCCIRTSGCRSGNPAISPRSRRATRKLVRSASAPCPSSSDRTAGSARASARISPPGSPVEPADDQHGPDRLASTGARLSA